jgi:hypothetical protein
MVAQIHWYLFASYELQAEGEKIVQILPRETVEPRELLIKHVQVVDYKGRAKPCMIPCCRLAMAKTASNPMEWNYYGKIGTWSRFFNWLWSRTGAILV